MLRVNNSLLDKPDYDQLMRMSNQHLHYSDDS